MWSSGHMPSRSGSPHGLRGGSHAVDADWACATGAAKTKKAAYANERLQTTIASPLSRANRGDYSSPHRGAQSPRRRSSAAGTRSGRALGELTGELAEAAVAAAVLVERRPELRFRVVGPIRLGEHELRVGALP